MKRDLPEQRCYNCGKLLYYGYVMKISIKCPRCKTVIYHEILDMKQAIQNGNRK